MSVTCSAPAKLILMGEHAAVYGRPALVAALDLRLNVTLAAGTRDGVELELGDLGHRAAASWSDLHAYAAAVRARWEAYAAAAASERALPFSELRGDDAGHVVKLALAEASTHLGERAADAPPLRLEVESAIPVGAGFGSSAATATAVIVAYLLHRRAVVDLAAVERLALEVERRQHGTPSGVDGATVLRGGVLWVTRGAGGSLVCEPLLAFSPLLSHLALYTTGTPREETGAVVAHVRDQARRDRARVDGLLDRIEACTRALRYQLMANDLARTTATIRECQACLEELGVVPPSVRALVRRIEAAGGAAKISGAGALSDGGAGSLIVYHPKRADLEEMERRDFVEPYRRYAVAFGAEGVREER